MACRQRESAEMVPPEGIELLYLVVLYRLAKSLIY